MRTKSRTPSIEHFRTFVHVAHSGSFSEAAKALGISQSGVSQKIKALESFFPGPLLNRGKGTRGAHARATLTEAGEKVQELAKDILRSYADAGGRVLSDTPITTDPI